MSRPISQSVANTIPVVKSAVGDALAVDNASLVLLGLLSTVGSSVIINDVKDMCPSLLTFWFTKFVIFYAMIYLIIRKPLVSLVWAVTVSVSWNLFTMSMNDGSHDHATCDACDGKGVNKDKLHSHVNLKNMQQDFQEEPENLAALI